MKMNDEMRFHDLIRKLKRDVGALYGAAKSDYYRDRLGRIYDMLNELDREVSYYIEDMNEMYLRNSSFPGDLIGWLDDDFTYDEQDDEDEESTKEKKDKDGKDDDDKRQQ